MSTPSTPSKPAPPEAAKQRVLDRSDYKLIISSFTMLAILVTLLILLLSSFKQMMAVHWLKAYQQRAKVEIRQYVDILSRETSLKRLNDWRIHPDGMPALFAAMAMARQGDKGLELLRLDATSTNGERRIVALAATEFALPGSLLPQLHSTNNSARWIETVQATALADAYAATDFAREMDGHFIALFPGKKAIPAEIMNTYQSGLEKLFTDPDIPEKLAAVHAFHRAQLKTHPELYKPGVLKKIQQSWETYLTQVFSQRQAVYDSQEAVRTTTMTTLPPVFRNLVNRLLADRYPDNPVNLSIASSQDRRRREITPRPEPNGLTTALPPGETLVRNDGVSLRALASPQNGTLRASAGFDNLIRVWRADNEASPQILTGHNFGIMTISLAPDGMILASAGLDGTLRLWNTHSGAETARWPTGTKRVSAIAFSPNGSPLATGAAGGVIRLLDPRTGTELRSLHKHTTEVSCLAFASDGKRLVSASLDKTLSVWNLNPERTDPIPLDRHTGGIWSLVIAPNDKWMASGDSNRRILLWNFQDLSRKPRMLKGHKGTVTALAASPNSSLLASAGSDGLVLVWDTSSGKLRGAHPTTGTVNALRFEPDGKTLLLAGDDGTLRRWTLSLRDERPFSLGDLLLRVTRKN